MRIGITGHQEIDDPTAWPWVREQMSNALLRFKEGKASIYSSLAAGADQLCAEVAVIVGYSLEVIVPCIGYEATLKDFDRVRYRTFLSKASHVELLDFPVPSADAYLAAGKVVIARSQKLIAVWDGKPAAGKGGTGDIVEFALKSGKPVLQLNPDTRTAITLDPNR